jgi:integrase
MGVLVKPDKHKPSLWWVRVNHKGNRKSLVFHDKATAKRVAQEIERRLKLGDLGLCEQPGAPTFAVYTDKWLAEAETRMRPGSLEQVRTHLKRVLPILGPLLLTSITRATARELVAAIQAQGSRRTKGKAISRRTIQRQVTTVAVILGQAVEDGLIASNPCARLGKLLPPIQPGAETDEVEVFTAKELAALLDVAQRDFPESFPFLLTLARTGIRLGEAIGLEWRDVDLPGRVLLIRRSVREGRVSLPKNGKPRRVDITPKLAACLADLRSLQAAEAALKGQPASERCFPGQQSDDHWRRFVWAPILRRAGLRYRKPHTLRHTYASLLLERRESLHYVQRQLGHHSPAFTLTVYGHLIPREGARAVDALDELDEAPATDESTRQAQARKLTPQLGGGALSHAR